MNTQKIQRKANNGITLIALVITIIVLLILAGVTIATLTGDNGILNQADKAKTETTMGEEKEAIGLAYNTAKTEKLSKGDSGIVLLSELQEELSANGITIESDKISQDGEGTITVEMPKSGNKYTITKDGVITDITLGNTGGGSISVNDLKVGDYVNYPDKNGNKILCKVLYNNENYGVQLVSVNPVDTVTLGYDDPTIPPSMASESNFNKLKYSYNNAIKTLNDKAKEYRNPDYTDEGGARCVGSVPDNPYSEASDYFTSSCSYMSRYNGIFKNLDTNYDEDWNQLETINARTFTDTSKSSYYWLSSRFLRAASDYIGRQSQCALCEL